jgi:ribosomal protein S18 acetylase RimI-like enzyme
MAVVIRRASDQDIGDVMRCLSAAFEPYRLRYTPDAFRDTILTPELARQRLDTMTIFVAESDGGEIVGTIAVEVSAAGVGHLRGMAVLPAHQGTGAASRLLYEAESELCVQGCFRVTLDTTEPLQRAIGFYTRHGYSATGIVRDFFGMPLFEYEKLLPGDAA